MTSFDGQRICFAPVAIIATAILLLSVQSAVPQNGQPEVAHKYIAIGKEIKSLHGSGQRSALKGDRIILGGDVTLPTSKPYQGEAWIACTGPDGHSLWSARAQEQPDRVSLFPLTTDGDSIWNGGLLKSGIFRLAKFDARSLRKQASVQIAFEPTTNSAPYIQLHSETEPEFDLQVSVVQAVGDSVRVALFSSDLALGGLASLASSELNSLRER